MRARRQASEEQPPLHLRRIDMGRYREVMAAHIAGGDVFGAGLVAWRAWCADRSQWYRARGLTWPEAQRVLGPAHGPDFGWIMREYGLPAPRWGIEPKHRR